MGGDRKILIAMLDGFGADYFAASDMPNLRALAAHGLNATVDACMPTVTNVNNAGIATGAWPAEHGITANSYFDRRTRDEHYMDRAEMLLAPTLFERAAAAGRRSALLTAKVKTLRLLGRRADVLLAAEDPAPEWVDKLGPPPGIYSAEINYWLFDAALFVLRQRPDVSVLYCHTTDYPMHVCDPAGELSQRHLHELDARLGHLVDENPDLEVYVTADHGMSAKRRCYDLEKYMRAQTCPIFFAMSAERDPYVRHHRTFGGTAYVWLEAPRDRERVTSVLSRIEGVEAVYDRTEAASRFRLHADRIGDLMVVGDSVTVFGPLARPEEDLPDGFRTHGSAHETRVPLIVANAGGAAPEPGTYTHNLHLTRGLALDGQVSRSRRGNGGNSS
jgi:phosphonoacetate hydrolase